MDRRLFIKSIGLAVAGAAIAKEIKLLEAIVPIETVTVPSIGTAGPLTFEMLDKAYTKACLGAMEPDLILMSPYDYRHVMEFIKPQMRFSSQDVEHLGFSNFKFKNAITTYGDVDREQEEFLGDYMFRKDPEIPIIIGINKRTVHLGGWHQKNGFV